VRARGRIAARRASVAERWHTAPAEPLVHVAVLCNLVPTP
jgi:hypothetical protein